MVSGSKWDEALGAEEWGELDPDGGQEDRTVSLMLGIALVIWMILVLEKDLKVLEQEQEKEQVEQMQKEQE